MGSIRKRVVSTVAISLSLFVWASAEDGTESPLRLPLHVYDYAGVAPDVRFAAAEVTRHIYAAIGVDIVWVDRGPLGCLIAFSREAQADTTRGNLMVTILPDAMRSREFPAAAIGGAPERGDVTYAFFDRISAVAFHRDVRLATLLGHVIAHEVGHVLLREGHAPQGLMRAEWLDRDLQQAKQGRLLFNARQGLRIRSVLGVVRDTPNLATHPHDAEIAESTATRSTNCCW